MSKPFYSRGLYMMVHVYRLLDIDSEQIQYVKYEFMTKMCFKGVYFLKVHCP